MWWQQDRIRSSPRQGQLLRLAPGAILCVQGRTIEVEQRDVFETQHGRRVRYGCAGTDARSELWIQIEGTPTITWSSDGVEQNLSADDIEVWSEG